MADVLGPMVTVDSVSQPWALARSVCLKKTNTHIEKIVSLPKPKTAIDKAIIYYFPYMCYYHFKRSSCLSMLLYMQDHAQFIDEHLNTLHYPYPANYYKTFA